MNIISINIKKIAFDLDGVLGDFYGDHDKEHGYIPFHNEHYFGGQPLILHQVKQYKFQDLFGISSVEASRRVMEFYETPFFSKMQPIEGSQRVVAALSQLYIMHLVTSRPESLKPATLQWLNKYFPGVFHKDNVHFTDWSGDKNGSKVDICKNLGVDVIIEDTYDYAAPCSQNGIAGLLLNQPWNNPDIYFPGVLRMQNWSAIGDFFNLDVDALETHLTNKIRHYRIEDEPFQKLLI